MVKLFWLVIANLVFVACNQSTSSGSNKTPKEENPKKVQIQTAELFTLSEAEKILGEPAHLSDSSSTTKVDTFEFKKAYTANAKEEKTGKTGNIYFMFEQYEQLAAAKNAYSSIKKANENHEGVKVVDGLADEAYYHSDGVNFYFYLIRKGNRMVRVKVNKITSYTSLDAFNEFAKNIAARI